ncbi:MAG TPA: c-type cytochrome [Gaiellaceae bacterium]|nr:c-type cytochrome [Gaiellaceae bacterium]
MLSTIDFVVAGLTTGHKIGLAAMGAAFILFSLVSSFVLPRRIPNFPGRFMGLFVTVAVAFFIAMLAAVIVLGREPKESEAATGSTTASTAPVTGGDPVAGKHVFLTAGCAGCHTLKDAGTTGTVGPDLDQLKPDEATVQHQVTNGGGGMPAFKNQLSAKQILDVAAYVSKITH